MMNGWKSLGSVRVWWIECKTGTSVVVDSVVVFPFNFLKENKFWYDSKKNFNTSTFHLVPTYDTVWLSSRCFCEVLDYFEYLIKLKID
jgi:hypothetical protein